MGAVSAIVYLLTIIIFIPFPFYKDIVVATSGGGNRDILVEMQQVETGRLLHRFPHSKARSFSPAWANLSFLANAHALAGIVPCWYLITAIGRPPWSWR